ncbi:hypothetical protein CHS0354_020380 [Potamilus streckersoni]|uniref:Uncharacterized protein n=1 Tax=Potamilus streckersoni TaxID=2493646 RepID=A0AAE0SHX7_9BIVA|nr:hypothetical protein CHS0354_020380 [Potamilus streckersoni]
MLQVILRYLPIDIGHIRTIKIMIGLLGFSLLLQLIAFTTPGWVVEKNADTGLELYWALMYYVECNESGCKTYTISVNEPGKDALQFEFASTIIKGSVPIFICSVSLFILLFSLRKPKWREPFVFFCTWILGIAAVLQWDLMAPFADIHRRSTSKPGLGNDYPVPWNVILHAISAFLTTTVMLVSLVILMRKLIINLMADDRMEKPNMTNRDENLAGAPL